MKVLWAQAALRHLSEAREYIAIDNPPAAERQIEKIELCANRLRRFPMMGRSGQRAGTSEFPVPGTPYTLVYRLKDESVEIVAVLHGARNWKSGPTS
jgi:toxin ParE1/3/4